MAGAGSTLTPLRMVEFRIAGAAVVFVAIATAVGGRRRWGGASNRGGRSVWGRTALGIVIAYGLIGFLAVQALYFVAIRRMPVGVALLIEYFAPALVALWAVFIQRRRQPRSTWFGIALTLVGLVLIARPWDGFALDGVGVTAALIAAAALAAYFLLAEAAGEILPPVDLCAGAALVAALAVSVIQPWWTYPWSALRRDGELADHAVPVWLLLVYVVVIGTVAAYLTGIAALAYLPAPVVAVLATIEVVFASVVAWLLLDERLTALELLGGAVLLAGAGLAQRRAPEPAHPATIIEGIVTP
jgi:drug/metabolite transporter (DMT)-like permease